MSYNNIAGTWSEPDDESYLLAWSIPVAICNRAREVGGHFEDVRPETFTIHTLAVTSF